MHTNERPRISQTGAETIASLEASKVMGFDVTQWHNTGGNGPALQVWVRSVGGRTAVVSVMPYRSLLDIYLGNKLIDEGVPFELLSDAQDAGNAYLLDQIRP